MRRTVVINVVGLTDALIGEHTPRIREFAARGDKASIEPAFPAVTCTAQATYLTGTTPHAHGIVGNGWYDRELAEVQFWKQSNHLVHGKKLWEELRERDPKFTCAKLFWWYNMYSSADFSITPRPMYPADGRKVFDIYTQPGEIRWDIQRDLGPFPFPSFWGPAAGVDTPQGSADAVSRWIAESARWIENKHHPTLNLIYLPHLDYNLQRHGPFTGDGKINPTIYRDLREIDSIVGGLIDFFQKQMVQVILLSEYGITNANNPIHINRLFREANWLAVRKELDLEVLDAGASKAFAVVDHQIAHIYLNDRSLEFEIRSRLESTNGVSAVLDRKKMAELGIDHSRAGDLIAVANENSWFTYYYWIYDKFAPDFARTVDIHRKPGYDPAELFLDPKLWDPKLKIAWRLLQKKLGFRILMDVIPLNAGLVKGSHGAKPRNVSDWPVLITEKSLPPNSQLHATDVYHILKRCVLERE
ncbi:MAG TPA: alkaline phosphatase family protein [Verrucomicrobiae bacterium]|jgi:predicted AlkP superfamily pyrophosphatase or phosphodiesterase|nr:alkaline phosphatase family protein [Verrucomicrobiae bacterium]